MFFFFFFQTFRRWNNGERRDEERRPPAGWSSRWIPLFLLCSFFFLSFFFFFCFPSLLLRSTAVRRNFNLEEFRSEDIKGGSLDFLVFVRFFEDKISILCNVFSYFAEFKEDSRCSRWIFFSLARFDINIWHSLRTVSTNRNFDGVGRWIEIEIEWISNKWSLTVKYHRSRSELSRSPIDDAQPTQNDYSSSSFNLLNVQPYTITS